jgi:hypothetical protein
MMMFWVMTLYIDLYVDTNISVKHTVSIFRAEVTVLESGEFM